jgi:hypothetical protein
MASNSVGAATSSAPISLLATLTQQIIKSQSSARANYYADGKRLIQIRDGKLFDGPKYKNFDDYIDKELAPHGVGRSWAYILMSVAGAFEAAHVEEFSFEALDQLCKVAQECFPGTKPADLLTGTHQAVDASGTPHVLDLSKDHSVEGLKAFRAAYREASQTSAPKSAWDPKVPDGGLSAKLPPNVTARSGAGGTASVTLKYPDYFASVIVTHALDAINQVLLKVGGGDPASPFRDARTKSIDDAVAAHQAREKQAAEKSVPQAKVDTRSAQQLAKAKEQEGKLVPDLESHLEAIFGKDDLADAREVLKAGDWKELSGRIKAAGRASPKKAARAKTAVETVKKLAVLRREIERLTKKVGAPAPAPTIDELSQGVKAAGVTLAHEIQDPAVKAKVDAAMEASKKGLKDLLAMSKDFEKAGAPPAPAVKDKEAKDKGSATAKK